MLSVHLKNNIQRTKFNLELFSKLSMIPYSHIVSFNPERWRGFSVKGVEQMGIGIRARGRDSLDNGGWKLAHFPEEWIRGLCHRHQVLCNARSSNGRRNYNALHSVCRLDTWIYRKILNHRCLLTIIVKIFTANKF